MHCMTDALGDGLGWNLLAPFVFTIAAAHGAVFCLSKVVQASRFERVGRWGKRLEIVTYLTTALMSFMLLKTWPDFVDGFLFIDTRIQSADMPPGTAAQLLPVAMAHAAFEMAEAYLMVAAGICVAYSLAVVGRRGAYRMVSAQLEDWTRNHKRNRDAEWYGHPRFKRLAVSSPSSPARLRRWLHDNPREPLAPALPRWEMRWINKRNPATIADWLRQDQYRLSNQTGYTAFNVTAEPSNLYVNGSRSKVMVSAQVNGDDGVHVYLDTIVGFTGQLTIRWHGPDHHEHSEDLHMKFRPVSQRNRYYWRRRWKIRRSVERGLRTSNRPAVKLVGARVHDG
jgi:hypothetical protein